MFGNKKKVLIFIFVLVILFVNILFNSLNLKAETAKFDLTARSALLMEVETGNILFEKKSDQKLPPASMSKIMTMLLVMEALDEGRIQLDDEVVASEYAARMGGSQIWLEPQERMKLDDMMKAISIASANDASVAVAEHIYGSANRFVEKMNSRSRELGLENTYFYNTNGLPVGSSEIQGNYSTARDLAKMSQELLKYPKVLEWTSTWMEYIRDGSSVLNNTNRLVRHYPGADGIKTGFTSEAGHGVVATAERDGLRFIAVIMGAETSMDRFEEAAKLLTYGFSNYTVRKIADKEEVISQVEIFNSQSRFIDLVPLDDISIPLPRGEEPEIETKTIINDDLKAPLAKNTPVGIMEIYVDGQLTDQMELVMVEEAESISFFRLIGRLFLRLVDSLANIL